MNYLYFLLFLLVNFGLCQAQNISFADVNFKNHLVLNKCVDTDLDGVFDQDADYNDDREIDANEAKSVKYLLLNSLDIIDISEIKYFSNLERLYGSSLVPIAIPFDLNSNIKLEVIELSIDFSHMIIANFLNLKTCKLILSDKLNCLYINNNINLKFLELSSRSYTVLNNIDTIDLSNNSIETLKMRFGWMKKNHKVLNCENNQLKLIEFSESHVFDVLNLANNKLNDQSITGSTLLANELYLQQNSFSNIHINNYKNILINKIEFYGNNLKSFKLQNNVYNDLEKLDFSGQTNLENIDINTAGNIKLLETGKLGRLKIFTLNAKDIESDLVLKETISLEILDINANCNVHLLDLGRFLSSFYKIKTLKDIHLSDNELSDLNIKYYLNFNKLFIENSNKLKSILIEHNNYEYTNKIVVQKNSILESFNFKFGRKLDLSIYDCKLLNSIKIESADTLNFEYSDLNNLKTLFLRSKFSDIEISNIPSLKTATCSVNANSKLKIAHLDNLDSLIIIGLGVGIFNLQDLPNLKYLAFDNSTGGFGCNNLKFIGNVNIEDFASLKELKMINFCVGDLKLKNLPSLTNLKFDFLNLIPSNNTISIIDLISLRRLELNHIKFENSNFQNLPALDTFISRWSTYKNGVRLFNLQNLKLIDFDYVVADTILNFKLSSLVTLSINRTYSNFVEFNDLPLVKYIYCNLEDYSSNLKKSKFRKLPGVRRIDFLTRNLKIDTIDVSDCPLIDSLFLDFLGSLNFLNLKNGNEKLSMLSIGGYADTYKTICVDNKIEMEKVKGFLHQTSKAVFEYNCNSFFTDANLKMEYFNEKEILAYPNPTNGNLTIENCNFDRLEVINYLGEVCGQVVCNLNQIDIANLNDGLYSIVLYKDTSIVRVLKILLIK
jgi:hypothetical protein